MTFNVSNFDVRANSFRATSLDGSSNPIEYINVVREGSQAHYRVGDDRIRFYTGSSAGGDFGHVLEAVFVDASTAEAAALTIYDQWFS